MAELVHFQLLELPACRLVGKELRIPQKRRRIPFPPSGAGALPRISSRRWSR